MPQPDDAFPGPVISGTTRLVAIIGDPVAQVRSPEMFNVMFRERGIDAVLVPVHVRVGDLDALLPALKKIGNLAGIIVTVPHKLGALRHADRLLPTGERIGAINALGRDADGRWVGENFDGHGFMSGLRAHGFEPAGKAAFLAGCGGAGRAVAHALADADVRALTLFDVDRGRAEGLAGEVRRHHPRLAVQVDARFPAGCAVAVNATPLGMAAGDPLPFALDGLPADAWVAEMVMKPDVTALLEHARARGYRTHRGRHVLEQQLELVTRFFGLQP